jgi:hypothetical protein
VRDYGNFKATKKRIVFFLDEALFTEYMVSSALSAVDRPHVLRRRNKRFEVSFLLSDVPKKDFGLIFNDALIAAVRLRA